MAEMDAEAARDARAPQETVDARFRRAWSQCRNPVLDGENPHFGNRFATLASTLEAVRAACAGNGLAYLQTLGPVGEDGRAMLESSVIDGEGGSMGLSAFAVDVPPNPQAFGSNLTYARRQQAQADWGIVGEDDDDGEAGAEEAGSRQAAGAESLDHALERAADACGCGVDDVKAAVKARGMRTVGDAVEFCGLAAKAGTLDIEEVR